MDVRGERYVPGSTSLIQEFLFIVYVKFRLTTRIMCVYISVIHLFSLILGIYVMGRFRFRSRVRARLLFHDKKKKC